MSHYSEMNFLFTTHTFGSAVNYQLNNTNRDNTRNIFNTNKYVVFKQNKKSGTNNIKNHYESSVYNRTNKNPYTKLLDDFNVNTGNPGAGLKIKAADLAYLRDLGVYPINRMAILRRFPEGAYVTEDLSEVQFEPISTVIGWIKPDQNFGKVDFNENWTKTTNRFDDLLTKIAKRAIKMESAPPIIPIPDFAQGMLYEFYNRMELLERSGTDDSVDEVFESHSSTNISNRNNGTSAWGLSKIPIGDPNVLQEGPFRNPEGQNIQSDFTFELETTYEQKLLGDVDPGSAMLDILDNLYAMGTSNMTFYWGDESPTIANARKAAKKDGNNLNAWWDFTSDLLEKFWKVMTDFFKGEYKKTKIELKNVQQKAQNEFQRQEDISKLKAQQAKLETELKNTQFGTNEYYKKAENIIDIGIEISDLENSGISNPVGDTTFFEIFEPLQGILQSILTSTIAIYRFEIRGSIELMVGGKYSSTPWHLSLGNPYSPWFASNHIIVKSASVESSSEMGFNDQPQRLTAKFTCQFSRALGKQELMRMFNNSFRRTYNNPNDLNITSKEGTAWNIKDNNKLDIQQGANIIKQKNNSQNPDNYFTKSQEIFGDNNTSSTIDDPYNGIFNSEG